MKNLELLSVQEMEAKEMCEVDGGLIFLLLALYPWGDPIMEGYTRALHDFD